MKIKNGGQTETLTKDKVINELSVFHESGRSFNLMINNNSLSYITMDELLDLRDEINIAIKDYLSKQQ